MCGPDWKKFVVVNEAVTKLTDEFMKWTRLCF